MYVLIAKLQGVFQALHLLTPDNKAVTWCDLHTSRPGLSAVLYQVSYWQPADSLWDPGLQRGQLGS